MNMSTGDRSARAVVSGVLRWGAGTSCHQGECVPPALTLSSCARPLATTLINLSSPTPLLTLSSPHCSAVLRG